MEQEAATPPERKRKEAEAQTAFEIYREIIKENIDYDILIKPYTDPVFENNIPLTQTERLTMNSRPKQPKYARNKNILVIGGSGSGKTRFFVKPSLMQMHSSYVVTVSADAIL